MLAPLENHLYTPAGMGSAKSAKRLNVDRKMVGVLSLFTLLGIGLLVMVIVATNSLSALSSYSYVQINWVEARKNATFQLTKYIETQDENHLAAFQKSMQYIEHAAIVRRELQKENTDVERVRKYLLKLRILAAEMDEMINTFERFQDFAQFKEGIEGWEKGDKIIFAYFDIAKKVSEQQITAERAAELAGQVQEIDDAISENRNRMTGNLQSSTLLLKRIILWVSISLGAILLTASIIFSFRFLKSIKAWYRELSISEQRYKSLFEQNPNAVFSMNKKGEIQEGNSSFSKMLSKKDTDSRISNFRFSDLFGGNNQGEAENKLEKVREGHSLSFEVQWSKNPQEYIYLQNTIMPIFVDENIEGIFGIAEDITFAKKAEAQIKEQLDEKTVLLAEIHHRVKNNLAIISGLLELQQVSLQEAPAVRALSEAKSRIKSIAMIHEKIYKNESLAKINFGHYVEELATMIAGTFDMNNKDICLHVNAENISINLDQSIPCGLILHELICNAYEHAFKGKAKGNIWVSVSQKNGTVMLTIADDGIGLPDELEKRQSESLGLTLIQSLTSQLEGSCLISNNGRTQFEITFDKKDKPKGHLKTDLEKKIT